MTSGQAAGTTVTREQLLASVHALEPGDVLLLRLPAGTSAQHGNEVQRTVQERLHGTGAVALVLTGDIGVEVYRAAGGDD